MKNIDILPLDKSANIVENNINLFMLNFYWSLLYYNYEYSPQGSSASVASSNASQQKKYY